MESPHIGLSSPLSVRLGFWPFSIDLVCNHTWVLSTIGWDVTSSSDFPNWWALQWNYKDWNQHLECHQSWETQYLRKIHVHSQSLIWAYPSVVLFLSLLLPSHLVTTNSNSNKVQSGLGIALNWLSALILNFLLYNWIIVSNVLLKHEPFHTSLHGVFFEPNQNQTLRTLKTWQPLMQASQISKHYDYQ